MDITHIPMARGFIYLAAVIDWYPRRILSWRVSITMDVRFCLDAVQEAIDKYGVPEIFNTDQSSQFTSVAFTELLKAYGIRISMDSKGCWRLKQAGNPLIVSGSAVQITGTTSRCGLTWL